MTVIDITIPSPKFKPLFEKKCRYQIYYGGRGSGKSQTVASVLPARTSHTGEKVACFREYQNSIDDSVYSLLKNTISDLGIPGYTINAKEILHESGSEYKFKGLARNVESIKSMYDFDIMWIEEAQTMSEESLRVLKPTLRNKDSMFIFTLNPVSRLDAVAKEFILPYEHLMIDGVYEDDDVYICKVNHSDNDYFPEVLEQERQRDFESLPRALYDHIWEGHFYDEIENSIIKAEWFDASIDAHKKLGFEGKGSVVVSHDPADSQDSKGLIRRHGVVINDAQESFAGNINDGGDWALAYCLKHNADNFIWDCDGMGVALQRQVSDSLDGRKVEYSMFRGSHGVRDPESDYTQFEDQAIRKKNKDTFKNRRAQMYWALRDRFYKTYQAIENKKWIDPDELISIESNIAAIDLLRSEVCRIPLKNNSLGMIQIMSKPDMKRLNIDSPGMADSLMMSFDIEPKKIKVQKMNFKGW